MAVTTSVVGVSVKRLIRSAPVADRSVRTVASTARRVVESRVVLVSTRVVRTPVVGVVVHVVVVIRRTVRVRVHTMTMVRSVVRVVVYTVAVVASVVRVTWQVAGCKCCGVTATSV